MIRRLIIIVFFVIFSIDAFAQQKSFDKLLKNLDEISESQVQEKVHLHLDKPYYAVGDDIWFKAYILNTKTGLPSNISSILYVDLINEKTQLIKQLKLRLISGITWADFKLPDTLSEGNYRIRAYTQWMRNADEDFFFDKSIKIGNSWANNVFTSTSHKINVENGHQKTTTSIQFTDKHNSPYAGHEVNYQIKIDNKIALSGKKTTNNEGKIHLNINYKQIVLNSNSFIITSITLPNKDVVEKQIPLIGISGAIDVQFLPEGGRLVENLPTKIAIKAIRSNGLGLPINGRILDNDGIEVATFQTNKLGMGSFILNPLTNQTYTARLTPDQNVEQTFKLPVADKEGAVLAINNTESTVMSVKVYLSKGFLNKGDYYLLAQKNGIIYFTKKINSDKPIVSLTVPKNNFPSGVVTITLFSSDLVSINERAVFINSPQDKIDIEAENLTPSYQAKQKVDLTLWATNKEEPAQGSFSIAVTNTTSVKPDPENESSILTQLLLSSDIKGYIEKPNYYFLNKDESTINDLDLLLLTQGWRKIDWNKVEAGKKEIEKFAAEKSLRVSGTVTKSGKPVAKGKITLASLKGIVLAVDTVTDENGHFVFDKIELKDTLRYVVQARTEKEKKFVKIILDEVPELTIMPNPNTGDIEVNVNQTLSNYLKDSNKYLDDQVKKGFLNKTIQLNQVNIVKKRPTSKQWEELTLPGIMDKSISAKELEKVNTSLSRHLSNLVGRIYFNNDGGAYTLVHSKPMGMAIFLDGFNYAGSLDDLDIDVIQSIEILTQSQGYAAGIKPGQGVIVISTKYGLGLSASRNSYIPGLIKGQLSGYDNARTFYSPKYDVNPSTEPDLRTTVFWEPQVISDAEGRIKINYFNTDVPGIYRIVIEGIDGNGNLGRKVLSYEVK